MYAHIEPQVSGWWAGVLHPMEAPVHLIMMVLVGLLGGLAVRAGRSSFTLPITFATALVLCAVAGAGLGRGVDAAPVLVALAVTIGVLVFVHPRHTGVAAPLVVLLAGALNGLSHGADANDSARPLRFVAGFAFTSGLLLAVGAIVGASIGRAVVARRLATAPVAPAPVDEHLLV